MEVVKYNKNNQIIHALSTVFCDDIVGNICRTYVNLKHFVCCSDAFIYIFDNGILYKIDKLCKSGEEKNVIVNIKGVTMMASGGAFVAMLAHNGLHLISNKKSSKLNIFISNRELKAMGINEIKKIVCGYKHMFIITDNGLYGIGENGFCELGIVCEHNFVNRLIKIINYDDVIDVKCGKKFSIFKKNNGKYYVSGFIFAMGICCMGVTIRKLKLDYDFKSIKNIIDIYCNIGGGHNKIIVNTIDGLVFENRASRMIKLNFNGEIDKFYFVKEDIMILSNKSLFFGKLNDGDIYEFNKCDNNIDDIYYSQCMCVIIYEGGKLVTKKL